MGGNWQDLKTVNNSWNLDNHQTLTWFMTFFFGRRTSLGFRLELVCKWETVLPLVSGGHVDLGGGRRGRGEAGKRRPENVDALPFVPDALRGRTESQRPSRRQFHERAGE